ncbi:helix-turn-helix domain-containing protein [Nocardioides luteus]|nr:XRE family transcriptional regulator [Nocardioides luteus]
MDKVALGRRIAAAREDSGVTQEGLARAVHLDRTAITRLEKGERKLNVAELVEIARTLGRPLSYFVNDPLPAVVSRRSGRMQGHDTSRSLDTTLSLFANDIRTLLDMELLQAVERPAGARVPRTHLEAENLAAKIRRELRLGSEPIADLGRIAETLGLFTYSAHLGEGGPDGGCVEVSEDRATLGAAVVNGDTPSGRRRMTLAHELGHWLCGDAYDIKASAESEKMINSFAIHLLVPRAGARRIWNDNSSWPSRDRALAVGAAFQVSWSATILQLRNVDLIDREEHERLSRQDPRSGDYLRLGLSWSDQLSDDYLSPGFTAAALQGYARASLTQERVIELLRGTLSVADLPPQDPASIDDLRRAFIGHDD